MIVVRSLSIGWLVKCSLKEANGVLEVTKYMTEGWEFGLFFKMMASAIRGASLMQSSCAPPVYRRQITH